MNIIYRTTDQEGAINKALVHHKGEFYVASENTLLKETLIFPATPSGDIKSYGEVGGNKDLTLKEVLEDFEQHLYPKEWLEWRH